MQKTFLVVLLFSTGLKALSQDNLPVIKAGSVNVDIRVDDDYFVKAGWILDPSKKPDVFSIGSKWLYETKKVTFITDIDSISVNIKPGSTFNFIILLNNATPCYIQIATGSNPVFMSRKIVIPLLLGFAIFLVSLYINSRRLNNVKLLYFGYITPLLFWGMTFLSGYIRGNYNHLKNAISDLGAIGTKSEVFTSLSLMLLAGGAIVFSIGLYRVSKKFRLSVIPAILSFCMPVSMIWAGIFTLGNEFHSATGALPFLVILAFLLSYFLWKQNKAFTTVSRISLLCFFIAALIALRFIQPFGQEYEGLIQRFFYLAWTIWTISIAHDFSAKLKEAKQDLI